MGSGQGHTTYTWEEAPRGESDQSRHFQGILALSTTLGKNAWLIGIGNEVKPVVRRFEWEEFGKVVKSICLVLFTNAWLRKGKKDTLVLACAVDISRLTKHLVSLTT